MGISREKDVAGLDVGREEDEVEEGESEQGEFSTRLDEVVRKGGERPSFSQSISFPFVDDKKGDDGDDGITEDLEKGKGRNCFPVTRVI